MFSSFALQSVRKGSSVSRYVCYLKTNIYRHISRDEYHPLYHSLDKITYQTDPLFAQMLGQRDSTDVFATFSFPNEGSGHRGYVMYELSEMMDGYIISSWFNYVHQQRWFQFPYQTAMEYGINSFGVREKAFKIVQTAFQFTTHGEIPELF